MLMISTQNYFLYIVLVCGGRVLPDVLGIDASGLGETKAGFWYILSFLIGQVLWCYVSCVFIGQFYHNVVDNKMFIELISVTG